MSRWLKVFLFVLLGTGLALAALPWWLGSALRPVLRAHGVTFASYERVGYAHFRLRALHYQGPGLQLTARQVEMLTPLAWLSQRMLGGEPSVRLTGWQLVRLSTPASEPLRRDSPGLTGVPDLLAAGRRLAPQLAFWLPRAQLVDGTLHGFGPDLTLAAVDWQQATLSISGLQVGPHRLAAVLTAGSDAAITATVRTADNDAWLRLTLRDTVLTGEAALWGQPLQIAARFPVQGWLPAEASLVAADWQLPAARLQLGAPYAQVRGAARLTWRENAFDLAFQAKAEPAAGSKTQAPPFEASGTAHGTLRELTLTTLAVNAPFATATLTAPVTLSLDHPLAAESAQLTVQADLAKLPWLEARGLVKGTLGVAGASAATARQTFALEFTDVGLPGFALQKVRASGALRWPLLELTSLDAQLDETSRVQAQGTMNCQTRTLADVAVQAKLTPDWLARWLPAGATWSAAEASVTLDGPLAAPRHQGSLKLTGFHCPPLRPVTLDAAWHGTGAQAEISSARLTANRSSLLLTGALDPAGLRLDSLQFTSGDQPVWQLAAPARLAWAPFWEIAPLQLAGASSRLTLTGRGGTAGSFELAGANFDSAWLQDWIELTGPAWRLHTWQASGRIVDHVLDVDIALAAEIAMSPRPARLKLTAHGDASGLQLKELTVVENNRVLTQATGRLPLAWQMKPTPHLQLDADAPLELTASTEPDSPLWAALAAATNLQLTRPTAQIRLKGSLHDPAGDVRLRVARVQLARPSPDFSPPDIDELALDLQLAREQVTLGAFSARLDGQAVQASGRLPMGDARWQDLWRQPGAFDWRAIEGRVEIPDADLAPLARRVPQLLAARGRLRAAVTLARGRLSGELHLADAATRPLPPFGTLQDITADLALDGETLTLHALTAKLGSEPVTLEGSVAFLPGAAPRLSLGLKGRNLPLVRQPGLLVRSDLDLRAQTDPAGLTHLTGQITLRDSLVLANFNTLLPGGPRGVTLQPPYFAVDSEPFRHWPLDIAVRGPRAIQLRTTVFNGTASARFRLSGTLGEPRAVGDLTVDQGQVMFPFAAFAVQQGVVRLSESDPFHAIINLVATGQQRDYQLRLEVAGQLPSPAVTLSSTPPLDAEEVLLMVMAGHPPTGDTTVSGAQRFALLGAYLGRGFFQDLGLGAQDRLVISSGEQVSAQGRETYEVEYKLGEHWSLVGEYDQYDRYNAGVKWRIYTQDSAPPAPDAK